MNETGEVRGTVRARPIRVAYLVEDGENIHDTLDAVFADAMSRWGGRFNLVCPCEAGYLRPAYLPWLKLYDPDIIYSYVDLSADHLKSLHELVGPSDIQSVGHPDDSFGGKRDFRIAGPRKLTCLSSLSTALPYARAFPPSAPQPIRLVDYLPAHPHDRFIDDNFGSHTASFSSWPLPEQLADAIKPISLASEEVLKKWQGRAHDGETVSTTADLLSQMAKRRNIYGLAQLSSDGAPRIELRETANDCFNLIVGDAYTDRILFWNCRSRDAAYLGREVTCLIVSPSRLNDLAFFSALIEFLKARNHSRNNQGPPWVRIRTTSLAIGELEALKARFQEADRWNAYAVAPPEDIDHVVPNSRTMMEGHSLVASDFLRAVEGKEFAATGQSTKPPLATPKHMEGAASSYATMGAWALDLSIQRQDNLSRYSNVRHSWFFPRRLRFHKAFAKAYEGPWPARERRNPRATVGGKLVLYGELGEDLPTVTLPSDETAFRYAFQLGDDWAPFRRFGKWENPSGPYEWAQPSDKGRYLIGALRLFGGLHSAASILLHRYWQAVFKELGGGIDSARREQVEELVKKRLKNVNAAPSNWTENVWERIASVITSEARKLRVPRQSITMVGLRSRHLPFLESEKSELAKQRADDIDEWLARARRSLPESVKRQCAQRVLFQGYQWRCHNCYHDNWVDIAVLSLDLSCEVCGETEAAPVEEPWSFRLNGFLQEALREHGVLALVWCLERLEQRCRTTFFYLGPHELWQAYPSDSKTRPSGEADLICVVDGTVHLCEVKSSDRDIDLTSLIDVAKRLRPDVVTLAVFASKSPRLEQRERELRTALTPHDIEVELLTVESDERGGDAYLP